MKLPQRKAKKLSEEKEEREQARSFVLDGQKKDVEDPDKPSKKITPIRFTPRQKDWLNHMKLLSGRSISSIVCELVQREMEDTGEYKLIERDD